MKAIPDLRFLKVAEEVVDGDQRLGFIFGQADVAVETAVTGEIEDAAAQIGKAAAVHAGGGVVFIEQGFEVLERPVGFGARERGHEMVDDDGAAAPLCLGALAGIVDDERVEMGQLAPEGVGIAGGIERCRLAGQPFERAVLAVVDQRMRAPLVPQPEIGGDVGVRGHEGWVVVAGGFVEMIAAGGLEEDRDIVED